ncbi:hypothetical protein SH580_21545 [Coraliomargarita algicola]|uniref:Uncharacterized protein n=1 Tax=Coraliomargarita algicola TaxID=3092156 RepID=A0ABZ0RSQ8_9BACT|nr:hypothetical protein [Coraliomargarita sp. J2-16]WPJ96004.1 hypothetical protein SH580_21545 [Coraliomargarita sp. J2-16]
MQIMRKEICVKRDKQLIFRSWRAFDVQAKHYQEVSDAVESHPNLVISIKHNDAAWKAYSQLPEQYPSTVSLYIKDYGKTVKDSADKHVNSLRS